MVRIIVRIILRIIVRVDINVAHSELVESSNSMAADDTAVDDCSVAGCYWTMRGRCLVQMPTETVSHTSASLRMSHATYSGFK